MSCGSHRSKHEYSFAFGGRHCGEGGKGLTHECTEAHVFALFFGEHVDRALASLASVEVSARSMRWTTLENEPLAWRRSHGLLVDGLFGCSTQSGNLRG